MCCSVIWYCNRIMMNKSENILFVERLRYHYLNMRWIREIILLSQRDHKGLSDITSWSIRILTYISIVITPFYFWLPTYSGYILGIIFNRCMKFVKATLTDHQAFFAVICPYLLNKKCHILKRLSFVLFEP